MGFDRRTERSANVRQYLSSDDLATELRLARSLDLRAVLVVEGATDARFFERFVDHEHCYVFAAHDRERAIAVIRTLNSASFSGALAVVDADFGRITGTIETDLNLLFCDGHDLEIMLVQSQALERVVAEHCSPEKAAAFLSARNPPVVLATLLARCCLPLGAMLLISLRRDLGLSFDDLSFNDFASKDSLEIDPTKLVRAVMNKSSRHDSQLAEQIRQEISQELSRVPQIWDMSRGHDCVELLSFALRSTIGTKKSKTDDRKPSPVTSELLERELRLAFSEADLSVTVLFQAISKWESANEDGHTILRSK